MDYALIKAGRVENVIVWDGVNADVAAALDGELVQVPDGVPVSIGWDYANGDFVAPPVMPAPPPTLESLNAQRDALLSVAALRIAPLQDAADLEDATSDELTALKAWKQYRVALSRLDLTGGEPVWPAAPEA